MIVMSAKQIVCPHCHTANIVPEGRLGDQPRCGKCHEELFTGHPAGLNAASLDRHINRSQIPLLVDFWAPWCQPCLMMAPAFEEAAGRLEPQVRLAKLNTEDEQMVGARFAIRSIPTMVLFRDGKEIARTSGAMMAGDIERWVRSQLG
jgi:thioredoxin 2